MAARVVVDVEPRRRDRAGRRAAARGLADPQPGARRHGRGAPAAAVAALRVVGGRDRRPGRPPAAGRRRRPAAGPGRRGPVRHHRHRPGRRDRRAGHDVPVRGRRGVRGHGQRHAAADARAARGPRRRQRPAAGRVPHDQPARRAARRRLPLRRWHGLAVLRAGDLRGAGRAARRADRDPARGATRPGGHPRAPRRRRRAALDQAAPAGAHARARHPGVQRDVGRGVVGAGAVVAGRARHGPGRLRPADHGGGRRRAGRAPARSTCWNDGCRSRR